MITRGEIRSLYCSIEIEKYEDRREENARANKRCCGRDVPVGHVVHIRTTGYVGECLLFYVFVWQKFDSIAMLYY